MQWLGMTANIQERNEEKDRYTQKSLDFFRDNRFNCLVLKGQGVAKLYGDLSKLRQSDDVDLWMTGMREQLYDFTKQKFGKIEGLTYHHIHFPTYEDFEIEVHSCPSFLFSLLRNIRFQSFCRQHEPKEESGDIPSLAFNSVYILLHCYLHFAHRGVGVRQLMDYYFVLK